MTPLGLQASAVITGETLREMLADWLEPLYEAVTATLWFEVNDPACNVTVAEFDPAPIVTDGATVTRLLLVERSTLAPPAGAFLLRVTAQVVAAAGESTLGLQTSEEITAGDTSAMVAVAELLL